MNLKSEFISFILKILLAALLVAALADLAFSAIYMIDLNMFSDYIYPMYGFVDIVSVVLYYVAAIVYLIWIYRVHMDLNRLYLQFPRTPGSAIACMIIPFYNFYGIPSIYQQIGSHYQRSAALSKDGQWIQGMSVPLIIFFIASNILGRFVSRAEEVSGALLFASSLVTSILYTIFFTLCLLVSRGLSNIHARANHTTSDSIDPANAVQLPS
ncbi:DUF4328 domain-containing protein [Paenibacillus lignilyticus]|uniref:DUF4328 domain-containing protein n=1 Tax=Paenibacillus lignilyticus TaxID=1172615 RepID=A0ABS5CJS3_9BACL|nr:DUF4328 domain-containing protein [Paenibacillus lignilyticus]